VKLQSRPTTIPGCLEIEFPSSIDRRGSFIKLFHASTFSDAEIPLDVHELFVSSSHQDVIRGLHFQLPPRDVTKLVVCLTGCILDAVVDLRTDSPTYGQHDVVELDAERPAGVLVPRGCAHGYAVLSHEALVAYVTDEEYDATLDAGIHWASAGIAWPVGTPVVSDRDGAFEDLADFDSPFTLATATTRAR
jgi:dTDP-4-dehydrorhamnose 3,5-epimerase